jgi:hypothetical protein
MPIHGGFARRVVLRENLARDAGFLAPVPEAIAARLEVDWIKNDPAHHFQMSGIR